MDEIMTPEVVYSVPSNSDQGADSMVPYPILVPDYKLPEDDVEKPFEPISACAIAESGAKAESLQYQVYPLSAEELKSFLKLKIDERVNGRRSKDVTKNYTDNIEGLRAQLKELRRRIKQITDIEKERDNDLKKRIKKFEKALVKDKNPPKCKPYDMEISNAAKEAFHDVGSKGPLDANNLFNFIYTGKYDMDIAVPRNDLLRQVRELRLCIGDKSDEGNHEIQFPLKKINKAIDEILTEIIRM